MLADFVGRHHVAFTPTNFYSKQPLLQLAAFTLTRFCTKHLLRQSIFAPNHLYTRELLHQTTQIQPQREQPEHAATRRNTAKQTTDRFVIFDGEPTTQTEQRLWKKIGHEHNLRKNPEKSSITYSRTRRWRKFQKGKNI